jgi:uncharacterized protein YkwD
LHISLRTGIEATARSAAADTSSIPNVSALASRDRNEWAALGGSGVDGTMGEIRWHGLRSAAVHWKRIVVALVVASAATTAGGALIAQTMAVEHGATVGEPARRVVQPATAEPAEPDQTAAVLALIDAARADAGLAPLVWNDQVAEAAAAHSADMAATSTLTHTGSDGSDGGERLTAEGFRWTAWGENIASGFTTPQSLVDAWMASSGHRRQLLGGHRYVGLAVATSSSGTPYWTLVVATG